MIKWMSFPKYKKIEPHMMDIVDVFEKEYARFTSEQYTKESNKVLEDVTEGLEGIGYLVEKGKRKDQKIHIPVLYGENGKQVLAFDADAYNFSEKTVIEVEAGRAVVECQSNLQHYIMWNLRIILQKTLTILLKICIVLFVGILILQISKMEKKYLTLQIKSAH